MFNCLLTLNLLVEAAEFNSSFFLDVFILRTSLHLHDASQTVGTSGNPYFCSQDTLVFMPRQYWESSFVVFPLLSQVFLSLLTALYLGRCFIQLHLSQIIAYTL